MMPARLGDFILYDRLGEGEMGTVYRATDISLQRDVAIKLVRIRDDTDPQSLERLRQEAQAAGKINHPRVAQVYALNFSNGHPYLVMELVPGEDLGQFLARNGAMNERQVLKVAIETAEGLSALNRENLVHGDIKPSNIVLDRDGRAKLVDFGLSGMSRFDSEGRLIGTPDYIAPELLKKGKDSHYSDLYSLGATLYHLRAGHPPFEGATPADVVRASLAKQPVLLASIAPGTSHGTSRLIMNLMEGNPLRRPENSNAVITEAHKLLALLDAAPIPVTTPMERFKNRLARFVARLTPDLSLSSSQKFRLRLITLLAALAATTIYGIFSGSFADLYYGTQQNVTPFIKALIVVPEPEDHTIESLSVISATELPPAATSSRISSAEYTKRLMPVWQSVELGDAVKRGGTIHFGDNLIFQGTGENMWHGVDHCRFVWCATTGDYVIITRVISIADTHNLALSGLLLKGADISAVDGLYFGFLGNGELALQVRLPEGGTKVIRRSEDAIRLPVWIMVARHGENFEAKISDNGNIWHLFAACELPLSHANSIGFIISANSRAALATASFADIRVLTTENNATLTTNLSP